MTSSNKIIISLAMATALGASPVSAIAATRAPADAGTTSATEVAPVAPSPDVAETTVLEAATEPKAGAGALTDYADARYGTQVSYPADQFEPQPAVADAKGQSFASLDGRAQFSVFATPLEGSNGSPERFGDVVSGGFDTVSSAIMDETGFRVTGTRGERVILRHEIVEGDVSHVVEASYDTAIDPVMQDYMQSIVGSLSVKPTN